MNVMPANAISAMLICEAANPALRASARRPSPYWCDTLIVAATPTPWATINENVMIVWDAWCAAIATAPNHPAIIPARLNVVTSIKPWNDIGKEVFITSINCFMLSALRRMSPKYLLYSFPDRSMTIPIPSIAQRLMKVAHAAPSTPIGRMPKCPKMSTQLRKMLRMLQNTVMYIVYLVFPTPSVRALIT